jgi:hypothetical protein
LDLSFSCAGAIENIYSPDTAEGNAFDVEIPEGSDYVSKRKFKRKGDCLRKPATE